MLTKKKKFPIPRPGSMRRKSESEAPPSSPGVDVSERGVKSERSPNKSNNKGGPSSPRLSFGARRPSFRFGRKSGGNKKQGSNNNNDYPSDEEGSNHQQLPPPPLPTTTTASVAVPSDEQQSDELQRNLSTILSVGSKDAAASTPMAIPASTSVPIVSRSSSDSSPAVVKSAASLEVSRSSSDSPVKSTSLEVIVPDEREQPKEKQKPLSLSSSSSSTVPPPPPAVSSTKPPRPTPASSNNNKPPLPPPTPTSTRAHTRSLTPSDYHYHTAPDGGVNAALTPISQHYQTNKNLLDLFSTLYDKDEYSVAYAVGVKFVEVALFQIPQHGYYKSGGVRKERTESAADAIKVTKLLGGMVDELEDDEDGRGFEKVEKLNKLANVAHQSFEAALDDQLITDGKKDGEEKKDDHINAATKQMSRIWKDYIVGDDDGSAQNNLCTALPDNICSFWNLAKGGSSREGSSAVNDAVMDDDDAAAVAVVGESTTSDSSSSSPNAKKRPRIDKKSLPPPPEPCMVPEVFIKKDSSDYDDDERKVFKTDDASERLDNQVVAKKVSETSTESDTNNEPMEVDLETPRVTHVTAKPPSMLIERDDMTMEVDKKSKTASTEHVRAGVEDELQLALSHSMQENNAVAVVSSSGEDTQTTTTNESDSKVLSLTLSYERKYHTLKEENSTFHVRFLDTFQGRNPKSTNGCTVIAPLTCIQYFTSVDQNDAPLQSTTWNNGIPDDLINQVIDEHATSVLPEVRNKLNLEGDSFIIPSDVHDHLIDVGLLSTSQFVGVCGGNILDDDHLASFKSSLLLLDDERERERLKGRKVAATFFFHGHVIALHVVKGNHGSVSVELIDSLPNPETWIQRQSSSCELPQPSFTDSEEWERQPMEYDDELPMNAVRVRCTDVAHFDTLIRHYACSKFSDEEQKFIDGTVWDDVNGYCESSFDPRVFQAFIWCEAA